MVDHSFSTAEENGGVYASGGAVNSSNVLDIYPLNHYYFGSKEALRFKEETLADRVLRMKLKYVFLYVSLGYFALFLCICCLRYVYVYFGFDFNFFVLFTDRLVSAMILMDSGHVYRLCFWLVSNSCLFSFPFPESRVGSASTVRWKDHTSCIVYDLVV